MKKIKSDEEESDYDEVRSFPLYVVLTGGIIIILCGIYLFVSQSSAIGITGAGRYGGGASHKTSLNWISTIIIGFAFCLFPIYQLAIQKRRRNRKNKN